MKNDPTEKWKEAEQAAQRESDREARRCLWLEERLYKIINAHDASNSMRRGYPEVACDLLRQACEDYPNLD